MKYPSPTSAIASLADTVAIIFDEPLDTTQVIDPTCFRINNGLKQIQSAAYANTSTILLALATLLTSNDVLTLSYEPSATFRLKAATAPGAFPQVVAKSYCPPFSDYPVLNLVADPEQKAHYGYLSPSDAPTVDDFILATTLREAIELSNPSDASATTVNRPKIEAALRDALALIDNYHEAATSNGKTLIASSRKRTAIIIARYYLDSFRRRKNVTADFENAIRVLESIASGEGISSARRTRARIFRVPQRYNRITRQGFMGFDPEMGSREVDYDWRGYYDGQP